MSPDCPVIETQLQSQLLISGVKEGAAIRKLGASSLIISVKASGGQGIHYWFKDQSLVGTTQNNQTIRIAFEHIGSHRISVIDDHGLVNKISFVIE
ncbi:MAG: hypothetical protein PHV54_01450 [Tolumonas sp.]|nr:hypothetical protein [Tolumonas sp.]